MSFLGASSSHPPFHGDFLFYLSIIRSLHLPAFVSFSPPSSSLHWDTSVCKQIGSGLRTSSHPTIIKVGRNVRVLRSVPRPHSPTGNPNRDPHIPQQKQQQQQRQEHQQWHRQQAPEPKPCSSPAQNRPALPGSNFTKFGALAGDHFFSGPLESVANGVKFASGVVKGLKDASRVFRRFQGPIGDACVGFGTAGGVVVGWRAAKVATRSLQMSKGILKTLQSRNMIPRGKALSLLKKKMTFVLKGFKAFDGAFTILNFAFGAGSQRELVRLLNWSSFQMGYKLSKSVVNILEMVIGLKMGIICSLGQGFLLMKRATEGVGFVVKAVFLSNEIYMAVLRGLGFSRENLAAFEAAFEKFHERDNASPHRIIANGDLYLPVSSSKFEISLTVANRRSSFSDLIDRRSVSVFLLVDSLSEANVALRSCCRAEMDHSYIFSLAIPLPSEG